MLLCNSKAFLFLNVNPEQVVPLSPPDNPSGFIVFTCSKKSVKIAVYSRFHVTHNTDASLTPIFEKGEFSISYILFI